MLSSSVKTEEGVNRGYLDGGRKGNETVLMLVHGESGNWDADDGEMAR